MRLVPPDSCTAHPRVDLQMVGEVPLTKSGWIIEHGSQVALPVVLPLLLAGRREDHDRPVDRGIPQLYGLIERSHAEPPQRRLALERARDTNGAQSVRVRFDHGEESGPGSDIPNRRRVRDQIGQVYFDPGPFPGRAR